MGLANTDMLNILLKRVAQKKIAEKKFHNRTCDRDMIEACDVFGRAPRRRL
ncbi:hypothetical protein [Cryobacterium sp. Y11]|uniref:hypothetical protein n=1 Tax=Cryobacterium sp. Y11 TaxID=2045016 RepID=UPI0013049FCF|nr:hypothetical protein [Cryobacterium sp. Y11]